MLDKEFRVLLNLWVVCDPWPLTNEEYYTFDRLLAKEARKRGYEGVLDAYHAFGVA